MVTAEQAQSLPLRKTPSRQGPLRLVEIPDFDLSACGGTHVARTGVVGLIAVVAWERFKGASRISFVCGGRALRSHAALRDTVLAAARALSVPVEDVAERVERLVRDAGARNGRHGISRTRSRGTAASNSAASVETIGPYAVVLTTDPAWTPAVLKVVAQTVVSQSGLVSGTARRR